MRTLKVSKHAISKLGRFDYPWTAAYIRDSYILKHTLNFRIFEECKDAT